MALRFVDGFDHYSTADLNSKYGFVGTGTTISTTSPRSGTACLRTTTYSHGVVKAFDPQTTWIAGVAVRPNLTNNGSTLAAITFRSDGVPIIVVAVRSTGGIVIYRADSGGFGTTSWTTLGSVAAGLQTGIWQYLEAKIFFDATAGSAIIRLNGQGILNLTGLQSIRAGFTTVNEVTLNEAETNLNASIVGGARTDDFDDFYVCDTSGTLNNDFLGDIRVRTLYPTADGANSGLVPSAGASHFATIDETTASSADYNNSATTDAKDTYVYSDVSIVNNPTVKGIQISTYASKSDVGSRSIAPIIRHAGVDYDGSDQALSTSYQIKTQEYDTNPGTGSAWTASDVNNAEFGVKVRP